MPRRGRQAHLTGLKSPYLLLTLRVERGESVRDVKSDLDLILDEVLDKRELRLVNVKTLEKGGAVFALVGPFRTGTVMRDVRRDMRQEFPNVPVRRFTEQQASDFGFRFSAFPPASVRMAGESRF